MKTAIKVYKANSVLRSRADYFYSVQSEVEEHTIYVVCPDGVAIMNNGLVYRIPKALFKEMSELAEDMRAR